MDDWKVRLILGAIIIGIIAVLIRYPELSGRKNCRDAVVQVEGKDYMVRICD